MEPTTTIRAELENFMKQNGLNITQFGLVAGINPGTISGIVTGNRALSVHQLDRITATLSHSKGHFYKNYIEEFLSSTTPNIRRVRPLLYNCAELDMLDCIEQVVSLLMEKLAYADALFTIAEDFFQQEKFAASIILYESIAVGEKKQHSERLALCQYRIFMAKQGDNQTQNLEAANQFEPYIERLNEGDQLEALRNLANTYLSLRQWDKLDRWASVMDYKAQIQYRLAYHQERKKKRTPKRPSRPLFFYIAYSNLLHACVCEAKGDYEKTLQYIRTYGDVSWVKDTSEDAQDWMRLFQEWAQANFYAIKLLSGDASVISDYVAYIESKKDETLVSLCNIIEAANRYHINVDNVIQRFKLEIVEYIKQQPESLYAPQNISDQIVRLLYELAYYCLNRAMYPHGFKYLIDCLRKSTSLNNEVFFIKCSGLFEQFKNFASDQTGSEYYNLINEVRKERLFYL
ncbi:helix-turn-helix domain-containing protein [Paenibacillus terrae]|uniref:DNA-binding protein n=1 Tax=Paenibacillus terrae TaxID=159743 RepID=A0A0D7X8S0_9BACL|nr:helix-turn-helix transcriptional regulator [Paenibacillus terrae]KJD47398.1 DNA-binding protein [Paenibacillus terrae]